MKFRTAKKITKVALCPQDWIFVLNCDLPEEHLKNRYRIVSDALFLKAESIVEGKINARRSNESRWKSKASKR